LFSETKKEVKEVKEENSENKLAISGSSGKLPLKRLWW